MGMYSSQHASAAKCYKIDFRLVCKTAHAKVLSKRGDGPPFDIYIYSHSRSMQSRCKFWGGDPVVRQKPSIPTLGNDRECGFQIELHKSMNLVYALETGFWPSSRWFQTIFFPFNRSCLGCSAPIRWDLAVWFQSLSHCSWQPDSWVVATRPAHSPVYGSRLKIPTTFVQFLFYT